MQDNIFTDATYTHICIHAYTTCFFLVLHILFALECSQNFVPCVYIILLALIEDSPGALVASEFTAGPRISRAQEPAGSAYVPKFPEQSRRERAASECTEDYAGPLRPGRLGPKGPWAVGPANFGGTARHLSKSKSGLRCLPASSHRR